MWEQRMQNFDDLRFDLNKFKYCFEIHRLSTGLSVTLLGNRKFPSDV